MQVDDALEPGRVERVSSTRSRRIIALACCTCCCRRQIVYHRQSGDGLRCLVPPHARRRRLEAGAVRSTLVVRQQVGSVLEQRIDIGICAYSKPVERDDIVSGIADRTNTIRPQTLEDIL